MNSELTRKYYPERVAYQKGYRVSECGTVVMGIRGPMHPRNQEGYFRFKVNVGGTDVSCPVHRLQAFQKYGDQIYAPGLAVRHKNNNSLDNSLDNILLGSGSPGRLSHGHMTGHKPTRTYTSWRGMRMRC